MEEQDSIFFVLGDPAGLRPAMTSMRKGWPVVFLTLQKLVVESAIPIISQIFLHLNFKLKFPLKQRKTFTDQKFWRLRPLVKAFGD